MAIIRGDGSRPALEVGVLPELHPVLDAKSRPDGSPQAAGIWSDEIAAARDSLLRAARAVGRVIPGEAQQGRDAPVPQYVGTAFVVAPRLAVTVSYVADALLRGNRLPGSAEGGPRGWLDLDDEPGTSGRRLAITGVHRVHPYWRFIFLTLDQEVGADSILGIAKAEAIDRPSDRNICVIGFPAFDTRSDPTMIASLFGNRFNIKRLMPGRIVGMDHSRAGEFSPMILHDASTLGGTGGAPLIDLASGLAIGINFSGQFGMANQATPAWEIDRDPQWAWLWARTQRGEARGAAYGGARTAAPTAVFPTQRLVALQNLLVENGMSTKTDVLLNGLPAALSSELRNVEAPSSQDRLYFALASLNRILYELDGTLPLETVLLAAESLSFNLKQTKVVRPFIEEAERFRNAIAARGG